jgi:DNA-binding MarR family transcriptional regulator
MDELGWVRRERFDNDARRVMVTLAPKTRALVKRLAPSIDAVYNEIEALIGREFTQSLYQSLDAVIARLGPGDDAADE